MIWIQKCPFLNLLCIIYCVLCVNRPPCCSQWWLISLVCLFACELFGTQPIAGMRNNCTSSVLFNTPSEQTNPPVTLFVLLLNYVHIRVIMTLLACRVMARMPVRSPISPKSWGGSHILYCLVSYILVFWIKFSASILTCFPFYTVLSKLESEATALSANIW